MPLVFWLLTTERSHNLKSNNFIEYGTLLELCYCCHYHCIDIVVRLNVIWLNFILPDHFYCTEMSEHRPQRRWRQCNLNLSMNFSISVEWMFAFIVDVRRLVRVTTNRPHESSHTCTQVGKCDSVFASFILNGTLYLCLWNNYGIYLFNKFRCDGHVVCAFVCVCLLVAAIRNASFVI